MMTLAKNLIFLEPRVVARVATTTLGPGSCPCPRPKEVIDWYTNSMSRPEPGAQVRVGNGVTRGARVTVGEQ